MPPVAVISTDKLYISQEIDGGRETEKETLQGLHCTGNKYTL